MEMNMRSEWVEEMQLKISKQPSLLPLKVSHSRCCIFRVPPGLVEANMKACHPCVVSIGPYHHGSGNLKMVQEYKWRCVRSLVERSDDFWFDLRACFEVIGAREREIRESYSENIEKDIKQLTEMMVVDGCFILYLLNMHGANDCDDPILRIDWVLSAIKQDLLKLENQMPFFILQLLFGITNSDSILSLPQLIIQFFGFSDTAAMGDNESKHLLDLVMQSLRPREQAQMHTLEPQSHVRIRRSISVDRLEQIVSADVLREKGFKLQNVTRSSFLEVGFKNGVLTMPEFRMDDLMACLILNSVAFERCYLHGCGKYFSEYAMFMRGLINHPIDADVLSKVKIMKNCYGSDEAVAAFFDKVSKDDGFDVNRLYLSKLIQDMNVYRRTWSAWWRTERRRCRKLPLTTYILLFTTTVSFFIWLM